MNKMAIRASGIINFEPKYVNVAGFEDYRPISATSIYGRYRVIDFMLSNMTNSGIEAVDVQVKNRPRSITEHINRTNYNINSKKGRVRVLYGERALSSELYNTDVAAMDANMEFLLEDTTEYVVIAPSHFIFTQDFSKMLDLHIEHNNDITILYQSVNNANEQYLNCDRLDIDEDGRVLGIHHNRGERKNARISLETYVMSKSTLQSLVKKALSISSLYTFRDVLANEVHNLSVEAFRHRGVAYCISTLNAYYRASLDILNEDHLSDLINDSWPIYTMTNDSCPTLFKEGSAVQNSIVGNGCQIEGTVINSIIGRNCTISRGAVIKNSIVLPASYIGKDVTLEYCVSDRLTRIVEVKELIGSEELPVYVKRGDRI